MFFRNKYKDVEFSITGLINGEKEIAIYKYKKGKGEIKADAQIEFLLRSALERSTPVGPVGEPLKRDINNPLAMLFILNSNEIFDTVIKIELISGTMPKAANVPRGAII